jgi:hypothetical protein
LVLERPLLVIAHPGHEIYLKGWCTDARPHVAVLTTGSRSGRTRDRIRFSGKLLQSWGCSPTPQFGSFEDRTLYDMIMHGNIGAIAAWRDGLARFIHVNAIDTVVVDAFQGYSVAHDLANILARMAVATAERARERHIDLCEFTPVPESLWPRDGARRLHHERRLSQAEIEDKLMAAGDCDDLMTEVNWVSGLGDRDFLASEKIHAAYKSWDTLPSGTPHYEKIGRERVAGGIYRFVLTGQHFAASVAALSRAQGAGNRLARTERV